MYSNNNTVPVSRKIILICLAVILIAVITANLWRLNPVDPDSVLALDIYSEILKTVNIVGEEYTPLTTTLGNYAVKKVSQEPLTAALMVRILKSAGLQGNSVAAINASGSFPGFTLAALSACTVLGIDAYVIASVGASSYGANVPGNTIADMLLQEEVQKLRFTLLAVSPGATNDQGLEIDHDELERVSGMLEAQGIPFIQPSNLMEAIKFRETMFTEKGCTVLINIGGNHASSGANIDLSLMSGLIDPAKVNLTGDSGLIQSFLKRNLPVIQILNVRKLYADYGLDFDQDGRLLGNSKKLLKLGKRHHLRLL